MIRRCLPKFMVCLIAVVHMSSRAEFSGYAKSFAVIQDRIDTPVIETDRLYQAQNSLRLMWQGFSDKATWQLHYELSPVLNSTHIDFDNATFATGTQGYRLSSPDPMLSDDNDKHQVFQNLDRLNIQFNLDNGDLTVGRQAISLGAARVINPVDVFLPFDVRTFNQEYRIGVDAVRFQYPFGQLGEIDVGIILGDDARSDNSAVFAGIRDNVNGYDLQFSVIRFADHNLVGGGMQSSLWNLGTWFEAARVIGDFSYWRTSMGVDYSFSDSIYGMVEYHYNGAGTDETDRYLQKFETLPYRQGGVFLLGQHYLIPGLTWQVTPLWTLALQSLHNLDDGSAFLAVSAQYNVAQNFYMDVGYYHFRGEELTEARPGVPVLGSEYGTNPDTLFASIKFYF